MSKFQKSFFEEEETIDSAANDLVDMFRTVPQFPSFDSIANGDLASAKARAAKAAELRAGRKAQMMEPNSKYNNRLFNQGLAESAAKTKAKRAATVAVVKERQQETGGTYKEAKASFMGRKAPRVIAAERSSSLIPQAQAAAKPASHSSGLEEVMAAAQRVHPSKVAGGKVMLHHVWAEYRKGGGKLSLNDFKQKLADSPQARLTLGLGRQDMPQTRRPGDMKASGVKSGAAEFNHMRVPTAGTGEGLKPRAQAAGETKGKAAALVASKRKPAEAATIGYKPNASALIARSKASPVPGLSREEVAAIEHNWWRVGAPNNASGAYANRKRLDTGNKMIDAAAAREPAAVDAVVKRMKARIEGFATKRETPALKLSPHGAKLTKNEYGNWGEYKGTKQTTPHEAEHSWQRQNSLSETPTDRMHRLLSSRKWNEHDYLAAKSMIQNPPHVSQKHYEGKVQIPEALREAVRDYEKTKKLGTLLPTKNEIAKQRKAQGIKGRVPTVIRPMTRS